MHCRSTTSKSKVEGMEFGFYDRSAANLLRFHESTPAAGDEWADDEMKEIGWSTFNAKRLKQRACHRRGCGIHDART